MSFRKLIIGSALALIVTAAGAAEEDTDSAAYMLPYCVNMFSTKPSDMNASTMSKRGRCMGIFSGLLAAIQVAQVEMGEARSGLLCTDPPSGRIIVLIGEASKYARSHPQDLRLPFELFVLMALNDAWPCKKGRN
jgi:Rap1a immunity proteins